MSRERPMVLTDRHIYRLADRLLYRKDIFNAEQKTYVHIPMVLTGRQRQKQADSYTVKILSLRTGRHTDTCPERQMVLIERWRDKQTDSHRVRTCPERPLELHNRETERKSNRHSYSLDIFPVDRQTQVQRGR